MHVFPAVYGLTCYKLYDSSSCYFPIVVLLSFSEINGYFASCSHDRTAKLWSTDRTYPLRTFVGHVQDVDVSTCVIREARACLSIKTVFTRYGDSHVKIRRSRDRLIFNMGIPILVRWHLYIEMTPRLFFFLKRGNICSTTILEMSRINLLALWRYDCDVSFIRLILVVCVWCMWKCPQMNATGPREQDPTDDKSTLAQVMPWCHQAASHCLSRCWSSSMTP